MVPVRGLFARRSRPGFSFFHGAPPFGCLLFALINSITNANRSSNWSWPLSSYLLTTNTGSMFAGRTTPFLRGGDIWPACQHVDIFPIGGYRRRAEPLVELVDRDDLSHRHSNLRASTRGLQSLRPPAEIPSSCWSKTGRQVTRRSNPAKKPLVRVERIQAGRSAPPGWFVVFPRLFFHYSGRTGTRALSETP